jgi:hypothetical protein
MLGFGDMYAKGQSIFGYLFLVVQVILGYVHLGALVTRSAVLFMAGGPAGTFPPSKTKETVNLQPFSKRQSGTITFCKFSPFQV